MEAADKKPITERYLEELRALADAATPGPWEYDDQYLWSESARETVVAYDAGEKATTDADGAFIARARSAVPELLDEIERLRGRVLAWKAAAVNWRKAATAALKQLREVRAELEDKIDPYFEIEGGLHERHDSCWCEPNLRERCSTCGRPVHCQPVEDGSLYSCERCPEGSR